VIGRTESSSYDVQLTLRPRTRNEILGWRHVLTLVRESGIAQNHEKTGCSSELGGQILGYAVCEISLFLVVAR
jgi:hypothetical protein